MKHWQCYLLQYFSLLCLGQHWTIRLLLPAEVLCSCLAGWRSVLISCYRQGPQRGRWHENGMLHVEKSHWLSLLPWHGLLVQMVWAMQPPGEEPPLRSAWLAQVPPAFHRTGPGQAEGLRSGGCAPFRKGWCISTMQGMRLVFKILNWFVLMKAAIGYSSV